MLIDLVFVFLVAFGVVTVNADATGGSNRDSFCVYSNADRCAGGHGGNGAK